MDSLVRFNRNHPRWQWRNDRECPHCDRGRVGGKRIDVDDFEKDYPCQACSETGMRYECDEDSLRTLNRCRVMRILMESNYMKIRRESYKPSDNWIEYSVAETFAMTPKPKTIDLVAMVNGLFRSAA